jgi:actin-related protein
LAHAAARAGGSALLTGARDRLERELAELAPHTAKVKVTCPANSLERRFSVWIGAPPDLAPCWQL